MCEDSASMHRDVSLSRIQGAAILGEGADGDGGKSFEASASGNDDLVLSLCFLVREAGVMADSAVTADIFLVSKEAHIVHFTQNLNLKCILNL